MTVSPMNRMPNVNYPQNDQTSGPDLALKAAVNDGSKKHRFKRTDVFVRFVNAFDGASPTEQKNAIQSLTKMVKKNPNDFQRFMNDVFCKFSLEKRPVLKDLFYGLDRRNRKSDTEIAELVQQAKVKVDNAAVVRTETRHREEVVPVAKPSSFEDVSPEALLDEDGGTIDDQRRMIEYYNAQNAALLPLRKSMDDESGRLIEAMLIREGGSIASQQLAMDLYAAKKIEHETKLEELQKNHDDILDDIIKEMENDPKPVSPDNVDLKTPPVEPDVAEEAQFHVNDIIVNKDQIAENPLDDYNNIVKEKISEEIEEEIKEEVAIDIGVLQEDNLKVEKELPDLGKFDPDIQITFHDGDNVV